MRIGGGRCPAYGLLIGGEAGVYRGNPLRLFAPVGNRCHRVVGILCHSAAVGRNPGCLPVFRRAGAIQVDFRRPYRARFVIVIHPGRRFALPWALYCRPYRAEK